MNKPKILIPQALPAVFRLAATEDNWLIFGIGAPDAKGKRPKRPVSPSRPWRPINRDKAARLTYRAACNVLRGYQSADHGDTFTLESINRRAREERERAIADGRKPGPEIVFEEYCLGYLAREGSALIGLDFDDVVVGGQIDDFEIAGLIEETSAYVEISSSGTGLRAVMPRGFEDGERFGRMGERGGVGFFVSDRAGFALTWNTIKDGSRRDEALLELVSRRSDAEARPERRKDAGDVADEVLDHGRLEVDRFVGDILPLVKNDSRFDEVEQWLGMVRAAREYFEVTDPDRLDEVREAVRAWSASWEGGDHDDGKFEEVWDREPSGSGGKGLGSWVYHAQAAGFTWETVPAPVEAPEGEVGRYAVVGGKYYDTVKAQALDASQMWRLSIDWKMTANGKAAKTQVDRLAWLAQNLPIFDAVEFRPGERRVLEGENGPILNSWTPIKPSAATGAPGPWLDHIRRLYGAEATETLVDWLAWVMQNPGKKVGWSPVLIGPQGCGKDTIITPLVEALGPYAVGNLSLGALDETHNGWIERALLVVMQENVAGRLGRANVAEKLKTMIAAPPNTLPLRKMNADTIQVRNVLNMLFLTNHSSALHVEKGDRRYWPIMTTELPGEDHFRDLYRWLAAGGAESVIGYLQRRKPAQIRERMSAPSSPFKDRMIEESLAEGGGDVLAYVEDRTWVSVRQIKNALSSEFGSGGARWNMSDKALTTALEVAGFEKREPVVVRTEAGLQKHYLWARPGVFPDRVTCYSALKAGGNELVSAQRLVEVVTSTKGKHDHVEETRKID